MATMTSWTDLSEFSGSSRVVSAHLNWLLHPDQLITISHSIQIYSTMATTPEWRWNDIQWRTAAQSAAHTPSSPIPTTADRSSSAPPRFRSLAYRYFLRLQLFSIDLSSCLMWYSASPPMQLAIMPSAMHRRWLGIRLGLFVCRLRSRRRGKEGGFYSPSTVCQLNSR